jgi:hypothetical protein
MLAVVDTETGRQRYVQTSSSELRLRYQAAANLRHRGIARSIAGAGAEYLHLSTSGDWLTDTWQFVAGRKDRQRAAAGGRARTQTLSTPVAQSGTSR